MEKMKPWNKGFIQQRSFNMAQPKDSQTQTQTLERPEAQQPNSDGWGIGPQRTLINPGNWGQPVIPGLDTSMQMESADRIRLADSLQIAGRNVFFRIVFDGERVDAGVQLVSKGIII